MAKPGYQAVALDAKVAATLRDVTHYMSVTRLERVTLSDALAQLLGSYIRTHIGETPIKDAMLAKLDQREQPARAGKAGR